jgi:uncharacterized membrane protein YdjX (TVP38/TMEM64 family)
MACLVAKTHADDQTAVGIILGELANYLQASFPCLIGIKLTYRVFKYMCRSRAEKLAKKNLNYACLSTAIAEGGVLMAFIVRLSVIPT